MGNKYNYIIIDDSQIDIFIATKMLQATTPEPRITTFLNAADALEMIRTSTPDIPTILLVDINMPLMDGFQFMEEFEKLPAAIKNCYTACFLTSSINESDLAVAKTIPSIKLYINKPLSQNNIKNLLSSID